jgi:fumarate hydratase, class II
LADFRAERDSMGELRVPADAYYAAQTARAVENFPVSGLRLPRRMIAALGLIKSAAAAVSADLGLLNSRLAELISQAADEVADGDFDAHFPVDIFQTGSGTSSNMNANEVIASRANELATGKLGGKSPVHPNDHVNLQQSSNDVFPSAIHIALALAIRDDLVPQLSLLEQRLQAKSHQFDEIVKIGRTHLRDATPVRVGQVFGGYTQQVRFAVERCLRAQTALAEIPLGGTAVGTGINSHPDFGPRVVAALAERTQLSLRTASHPFEAQGTRDALLEASGLLRTVALSLHRIANDIRHLSSGPDGGIGELILPAVQPGSSIMPGKVNPVMCEMLMMTCARIIGADAVTVFSVAAGSNFELSAMLPVIAHEQITSTQHLARAVRVFTERCVAGIDVDRERCRAVLERSPVLATALAPLIGYDAAADLAKAASQTGRTVRDLALERKLLPENELDEALDPLRMTYPQADIIGPGGA